MGQCYSHEPVMLVEVRAVSAAGHKLGPSPAAAGHKGEALATGGSAGKLASVSFEAEVSGPAWC